MKDNWEKSCDKVLESEGGYQLTTLVGDSGGQTYAGIARNPNPHWEGWKLISMKYSDIFTLVNGSPSTPKGNGLHNPNKLSKISMLHLANPNNGFASTKLDYIMFSNNKPLEP